MKFSRFYLIALNYYIVIILLYYCIFTTSNDTFRMNTKRFYVATISKVELRSENIFPTKIRFYICFRHSTVLSFLQKFRITNVLPHRRTGKNTKTVNNHLRRWSCTRIRKSVADAHCPVTGYPVRTDMFTTRVFGRRRVTPSCTDWQPRPVLSAARRSFDFVLFTLIPCNLSSMCAYKTQKKK